MSAAPTIARYAQRYCELGMALTWTPLGHKGPRHAGWNLPENAVRDPAAALDYWSRHADHGIAVLLEPSRLVSVDIDDELLSREVLRHFDVDVLDLRECAPTIEGRHYRMMFRAPPESLTHRALAWPLKDDPRRSAVLFEFRAGNLADTLPPTRHAMTGLRYRWLNPPRDGFLPLPARFLELWRDWPTFSREALALCPWAPPPEPPRPSNLQRREPPRDSVINQFNAAHDVAAILEAHGYRRRGKRFSSPETGHAAGVVLLDSGKVYCHHVGDPLHSEHALDAFDLYRILDHGGDYRSAVKAAAAALGLDRRAA